MLATFSQKKNPEIKELSGCLIVFSIDTFQHSNNCSSIVL